MVAFNVIGIASAQAPLPEADEGFADEKEQKVGELSLLLQVAARTLVHEACLLKTLVIPVSSKCPIVEAGAAASHLGVPCCWKNHVLCCT
mgnify:CR=1 FL=1